MARATVSLCVSVVVSASLLAQCGRADAPGEDNEEQSRNTADDASADSSGQEQSDDHTMGALSNSDAAGSDNPVSTQGAAPETEPAETPRDSGDSGDSADSDNSLSARYPGDMALSQDPAVLFFDDFETGWGRWTAPSADTKTLTMRTEDNLAHAGSGYLESTVTVSDLQADQYISSQSHIDFERRVEAVYVRFYARFAGTAPTPHHWVRLTAGTPPFTGSGLANTVPAGDQGFWFDFDANLDDVFNFYVYWYKMRSGRCNDGSTVDGCAGDQGTTYHYGNNFRPPDQMPFQRDTWLCIEMYAKANDVGQSNGELAFWIDDEPSGAYGPGFPEGTWLRDSFHEGGCDFSACTEPAPFSGFDFRADDEVLFKAFVLDAYYERGSSQNRREQLEERGINVDDAHTVLYDDLVIATERIGCRKE